MSGIYSPLEIMWEEPGWVNLRQLFPLLFFWVAFAMIHRGFSSLSVQADLLITKYSYASSFSRFYFFAIERTKFDAEAIVRIRPAPFCILSCAVDFFGLIPSEVQQITCGSQLDD